MKIYIPTIILAVLLASSGCNSNKQEQTTSENPTSVTDLNTEIPVDSVTNSIAPVTVEAPIETPAQVVPATPIATNSVALNPAHGAPGHRCDIDVGQPLNSPPKASLQQVAQPAPQPATPQFTPPQPPVLNSQPAGAKLTLNPEHGKPGHRCEIAVGAPLN